MKETLVRVSLPYAVFGLLIDDDSKTIAEAPPIASWAHHKPAREVLLYFKRRGATLERVTPKDGSPTPTPGSGASPLPAKIPP